MSMILGCSIFRGFKVPNSSERGETLLRVLAAFENLFDHNRVLENIQGSTSSCLLHEGPHTGAACYMRSAWSKSHWPWVDTGVTVVPRYSESGQSELRAIANHDAVFFLLPAVFANSSLYPNSHLSRPFLHQDL